MQIKNLLAGMFAALALSSCFFTMPEQAMTPLEIQSFQSRQYESSKEIVFPSIISVFQDMGYTISNADIQTGLISAQGSAKSDLMSIFSEVAHVTQTKATAFVEQIGNKTRARLNFVEVNQTSSEHGQTSRHDTPILDAKLYQNAFEKIENAIFIRSTSN